MLSQPQRKRMKSHTGPRSPGPGPPLVSTHHLWPQCCASYAVWTLWDGYNQKPESKVEKCLAPVPTELSIPAM